MIERFFESLAGITLISAAITAAVITFYFSIKRKNTKKHINWARVAAISIFVGYMAGLFGLTLELSVVFSQGFKYTAEHNFIPFKQIIGWFGYLQSEHTSANLWGNIFIFVPVGFGILMLDKYKRPVLSGVVWTAAISMFIELFQFFTPRTSDIDDVILNTVGGLIGALLYLLFRALSPATDKLLKQPVLRDKSSD